MAALLTDVKALTAAITVLLLSIEVAIVADNAVMTPLIDVMAFVFVVMFVLELSMLVAIVADSVATVADIATLSPPITKEVADTVSKD